MKLFIICVLVASLSTPFVAQTKINLQTQVKGVLFPANGGTVDVSAAQYGMKCDGTDDTTAFNNALHAIYNTGGGTVKLPSGHCVVLGQITIPNDGGSTVNNSPLQPSIRITGSATSGGFVIGGGGTPIPFGSGPAYGGTVLDLKYNSPTAKIDSRGTGPLEIDHLTLADTSTDCATFIFVSNTILSVHDVTFLGTKVGTQACNDAIWLGNNNATPSGNFDAPFQGYGAIITHNFFQTIKRAVFGQAFANSVFFVENTIWSSSGNSFGGAIEFGASHGNANGNYIAGNLLEVTAYQYGIRITNGVGNKIIANDCWDPTPGLFVSCVRLEDPSVSNFIIEGISMPGSQPYLTDTSNSPNGSNVLLGGRDINIFNNPTGTSLKATAALTAGQVVKLDTAHSYSVVVNTTGDTGPGIVVGVVVNSPSINNQAFVAYQGRTALPILGTGTCSLGQLVIVDTTTNGRVQCTSSYTAGTVIGTVISAQASVGSAVGVLLGLR